MKNKKTIITLLCLAVFLILNNQHIYAAPSSSTLPIPNIDLSVNGSTPTTPQAYVDNIKLLLLLTGLSLLPSILLTMTSFTRIIVVLGFLKNALGTQQTPPNQVLVGLALFLSLFVMTPTVTKINNDAVQPYLKNEITQEKAIALGSSDIKSFMLKQTRQKDLKLFMDIRGVKSDTKVENLTLDVVIPSYIISELKTAFTIGFLIYLPFLVIDFVVSSVLMSMGMFMLSPMMISLPFKLLLFVMVDGWNLIVKSLILSFN